MMKCLIIDDEQPCIDALAAILKVRFADVVSVCACTTDGRLAQSLLSKHLPDIMFLDVEMPFMNGIEIINTLPDHNCEIIITTAYEQYALKALKHDVCDYLLKPISIAELSIAIQKCTDRIRERKTKLLHAMPVNKLSLPIANGVSFADIDDIVRIECHNNYCCFYFTSRPKLIVAKTLKEYEERLSACNFFRVHQSHLVNLRFVETYQSTPEEGFILLSNKEKIEVSRRRKAAFLERLSSL